MNAHSFKLVITKSADADERAIYQYIEEAFGSRYADIFQKRLIDLFQLLIRQPFIGRPTKQDPSIRVLMMSKQNKILYKLTETDIVILRILNTKRRCQESFNSQLRRVPAETRLGKNRKMMYLAEVLLLGRCCVAHLYGW